MKQKITCLRNLLQLSLLFAFLLSFNANGQTVIFFEDFSSITTGDNTTLTGSETPWTTIASFQTAWRTFQAGGALRLGNGNATANLGYVQTRTNGLDFSQNGGNFTIQFDVKGWTTVENQIKVIVTGMETREITYTATINQPFKRITLNYTGGVRNSRIIIETTEKRAFIDNILITTTPAAVITAPVATAATDNSTTGFTANWNALTGATGYLLDVSTSATFDTFVSGYENLAVTGTSQTVIGLVANTAYYYRVRAVDATSTSVNSNVIKVTTLCGTIAPPTADAQVFCADEAATIADIEITATGTVQWFATATSTDSLEDTEELVSGSYYVSQTIGGCESLRREVAISIETVTKPVGAATQTFTSGQTLADLEVTANDNLVWYADEALTEELEATEVLEETTYYAVEQTGNCTSEVLAITTSEVLSNASFSKSGLQLYPNPIKDVMNISATENISSVTVYNLLGQVVITKVLNATLVQVDISGLQNGAYMVNIMSGNQSKTIRVIKQ